MQTELINPKDLTFKNFVQLLVSNLRGLLICSLIFALIGTIYAISINNFYQSVAILKPAREQSGSVNLGGYAQIASMAGLNVGKAGDSKTLEAVETIKTFSFFINEFLPYIKSQDLAAVKRWDSKTNLIEYGSEFDVDNNDWLSKESTPTSQDLYTLFLRAISISVNKDSGFVNLSVEHQSPYLARDWANLIVTKANKKFREEQRMRSINNISYLSNKILDTNLTELREALASLIQSESQQLMLADGSENYVFEFIEPPYVKDKKSRPMRSLIVLTFFFVGFSSYFFYILLRYAYQKDETH